MHRKLQDVAGTARLNPEVDYARRARFLQRLQAKNLQISDKSFLEVGTGWHPMLPIFLHLLGARRVITVDLNRWLSRSSLQETAEVIEGLAGRFASDFGVSAASCRVSMRMLRQLCHDRSLPVDEILRTVRIDYRCPVNASNTYLPDEELDYVVSTNVLEHVPPDVIRAMLTESRRILKRGGHVVHHIDPGDHFSYDTRISTINFLRFSPRAWYYIGGSGMAYHNRLRCIDYVRMVAQSGLEIVEQTTELDERAISELELGRVKPHRVFREYTPEQLCERSIVIVARSAD